MWTGLPQRGQTRRPASNVTIDGRGRLAERRGPDPDLRARPSAWRRGRSRPRAIGRCAARSTPGAGRCPAGRVPRCARRDSTRPPARSAAARPVRPGHRDQPPAVGALPRPRPARGPDLQPTAARAVEPDVAVVRLAEVLGTDGDGSAASGEAGSARRTSGSRSAPDRCRTFTLMVSPQRQVTRDMGVPVVRSAGRRSRSVVV